MPARESSDTSGEPGNFRVWHAPEVGKWGGACLLRPGVSDVDLFRYFQGVIYFDAQISDGAFDPIARGQ